MYLYDIQGCVCKIYKDVYVSLVMQLCNSVLLKIPSTTAISSKILPPHSAYIKTFPRCHQGGMAPPRVGTTVGAWSPKRGHQVLTRDLCPGMLPAVRAVCRWHSGSLPEQGWSLLSLSCHGNANPWCPSPAGPSPGPAVPRCCRRALCPKVALARDWMSPHQHPKVRLNPRPEHPEPSTPRPLPRGDSKGIPVSLSGQEPIPWRCSETPTHNPSTGVSLTPTALPAGAAPRSPPRW